MLVSAIMPTNDRRKFIPLAIASYLTQDWKEKELIVIDDGTDPVREFFTEMKDVTYIYIAGRQPIGTKRNLACECAKGEIIVHWDDDDWSAPTRISSQVAYLEASGKSVTGYSSLLYWEEEMQQASRYTGETDYALGSSLAYRRNYWDRNRFLHTSFGEDSKFVENAQLLQQIAAVPGGQMMVARLHPGNTSQSALMRPVPWPSAPIADIPQLFFDMSHAAITN